MQTLRTIRNLSFVAMLCAMLIAMQARVLASMGDAIETFCENWEDGENYDCDDCTTGEGFPPGWGASGSCDFSGIEDEQDRQLTAAAYCSDMWDACDSTCIGEYPDYLVEYYGWSMSSTHPCYDAYTTAECWWTWGNGSCDAGASSDWSCSCQRWNICECGE
ncbi:MAG TPA: hypothetical protein VH702_21200 [Vicinamibacterales bacterium]|jgi:hypothetical protein